MRRDQHVQTTTEVGDDFVDEISSEDIVSLEIPTGEPIHYTYDEGVISRDR